jgi:hypothetical protein
MAKLIGKAVGETIVVFLGPITGRNYNVSGSALPGPATIAVQVFGTGAVTVETTQTFDVVGNAGLNVFTHDKRADPGTWVVANAGIDQVSGYTPIGLTPAPLWMAIRVIVDTPGEGRVIVTTDWD